MKKILFICQTNNALKGTEKTILVLANGFSEQYDIHYLAVEEEEPALTSSTVTFHFLNLKQRKIPKKIYKALHFLYLIFGIHKTIKSIRPDIVISSLDEINIATSLLVRRHKSVIFIGTIHTNPNLCLTGIKKLLARLSFPKFHHIVCVSEGIKESLHAIVPNSNARVIYNPVDTRQRPPRHVTELKRLIFIGNLNRYKGIHHLLRVIKVMPEDNRPTLDVLGTGELQPELEKFCNENQLTKYVTFHGMQRDIFSYIAGADALVLPTYSEAFALVLVEALKGGIPIITSDANYGPREILDIKEPIKDKDYIKTSSGILLPAPSYSADYTVDYNASLTTFEKKLYAALTDKQEFKVTETLCNRFDAEKILCEWDYLFKEMYI